MKTDDFILRYETFSMYDSLIRVRIFDSNVVILSDIGNKNTGASITNSIESARKKLLEDRKITDSYTIVEHYEYSKEFDIVTFDAENSPSWHSVSHDEIKQIAGIDDAELNSSYMDDRALVEAVDLLRLEINPDIDKPLEEPEYIARRRAIIESNKISKRQIADLIHSGAIEQDMQRLLKADLSIFGELYSSPHDEYICFSEFPIGDGFADFVVFTNRSRMEVIVIEAKGADYNLMNSTGYENFSAKTNEVLKQLRTRLSYIQDNYNEFRKFVHNIRLEVEGGVKKHNSFLCPQGFLHVDADKDIVVKGVAICGRTVNDLKESKERNNCERQSHPTIRVETWDSWLNKLQRDEND